MVGKKRNRVGTDITFTAAQLNAAKSRAAFKRQKRVIENAAARRQPVNIRTGGLLAREIKYLDTERVSHNIKDTVADMLVDPTTALCLNAVPPGNGASQRVGRQISMLKLSMKLVAQGRQLAPAAATATLRSQYVRVLIFLDTQTNSALTAPTDVMNALATDKKAILAMPNMENSERFKILYDQQHKVEAPTSVLSGTLWNVVEGVTLFNIEIPLNGMIVNYNQSGATYASISDNSLHVAAINYLDDAQNGSRISYTARLLYKDQ